MHYMNILALNFSASDQENNYSQWSVTICEWSLRAKDTDTDSKSV